ncbi:MAG: hypothetical protein CVU84_05060 [Firmicutes bacterium HGW-Firmicutes-1]|nr:MAG: hypothetical protein CVU84_05060 [Firmicutes bacterium HGW-Firmicutes-1]
MKRWINIRTLHMLSLLAILGVLFIAAIAFVERDVAYISVFNWEKYEIGKCFYRTNFGFQCPSCGLTRSFISLENFNFTDALRYNRVGFLVYLLMVFTAIFNIMGLLKAKVTLKFGKFLAGYGFLVCILLVISWTLKVLFY